MRTVRFLVEGTRSPEDFVSATILATDWPETPLPDELARVEIVIPDSLENEYNLVTTLQEECADVSLGDLFEDAVSSFWRIRDVTEDDLRWFHWIVIRQTN